MLNFEFQKMAREFNSYEIAGASKMVTFENREIQFGIVMAITRKILNRIENFKNQTAEHNELFFHQCLLYRKVTYLSESRCECKFRRFLTIYYLQFGISNSGQ